MKKTINRSNLLKLDIISMLLIANNETQKSFGKKIFYANSYICNLINKKYPFTINVIENLANYLEISINDLIKLFNLINKINISNLDELTKYQLVLEVILELELKVNKKLNFDYFESKKYKLLKSIAAVNAISNKDLINILQIKKSQLSEIKSGKRNIPHEKYNKLLNDLGYSLKQSKLIEKQQALINNDDITDLEKHQQFLYFVLNLTNDSLDEKLNEIQKEYHK